MTAPEELFAPTSEPAWALAPEPEPVFGMIEVALAFATALVAMLFCGGVAIALAHRLPAFRGVGIAQLAEQPRVLLPAQLVAYLMVLAALWRLFSHHHQLGFFGALHWNFPARPLRLVSLGVALAVAVQVAAHFLPSPPELPIDKMLETRADAWLMSAFGVLVAPFVEEVFFRGLLFPALARRAGLVVSVAVTSLAFGAVHAEQLAGAWIQVACIVIVGLVLTLVRYRYRSLAASTLVHVGYNGALFAALFVQTKAFTDFTVK